jgi:hypothetical protein
MVGLKELAFLAILVVVLYGRSGVLKSRRFQSIWPWIAPIKRTPRRHGPGTNDAERPDHAAPAIAPSSFGRLAGRRGLRLEGNRVYWFLTILAATAVAAWIVTRMLILEGASHAPPR